MERIQIGEVILFKEGFLGGLTEHTLYGTSNEFGNWVSFNDICELLCFSKALKKRVRKGISEENKCKIPVHRNGSFNEGHEIEEYFVRDTVVYDIIMKDREERRLTEQFIFDVLGQLNGDISIDPEKDVIKEFINEAIDNDALEEFTIDVSKMDYYLDFEEGCNQPIMKKKDGYEEQRELCYKRNRGQKSTCPDWLKDVIK